MTDYRRIPPRARLHAESPPYQRTPNALSAIIMGFVLAIVGLITWDSPPVLVGLGLAAVGLLIWKFETHKINEQARQRTIEHPKGPTADNNERDSAGASASRADRP